MNTLLRLAALPAAILLSLLPGHGLANDPPDEPLAWLSLGAGLAGGNVDLPCNPAAGNDECEEDGTLPTLTAALTMGRDQALRLRVTDYAEAQTEDTPRELALSIGTRLSDGGSWLAFIGGSRILHPDDDFEGRADGVNLELVYAPVHSGRSPLGFEFGLHYHRSKDVAGGGLMLGLRFGRLH